MRLLRGELAFEQPFLADGFFCDSSTNIPNRSIRRTEPTRCRHFIGVEEVPRNEIIDLLLPNSASATDCLRDQFPIAVRERSEIRGSIGSLLVEIRRLLAELGILINRRTQQLLTCFPSA